MSEEVKLDYDLELKPGEVTPHFNLSPADKEILIQLYNSRGWKLYAKMISIYGTGTLNSLLALEDPVKIQKSLGLVAGVNFSINQLGIQVARFKKQAETPEEKRVRSESKKAAKLNR